MKRVGAALALVCALGGGAFGDAKQDRAAVAQLEAMYAPIGQLVAAERVNRACGEATKLRDASQAFSDEKAPAGAVVDDQGWASVARNLEGALNTLVAVCKAPDRKRKMFDEVQTADQIVVTVDQGMRALFELVKPRTLPASVKKFKATLASTKFPSKAFCARVATLAKQSAALATPPAQADAAAWQQAAAAVKRSAEGLACTKPAAADEQMASGFVELHDQFYALVLLVPAS
jgi:hypothetical protein